MHYNAVYLDRATNVRIRLEIWWGNFLGNDHLEHRQWDGE
jgi:hypothetical protein